MSRKPTNSDSDPREVAERSMPGWEAVPDTDAPRDVAPPKADFVGKDIAALKAKYLGALTDSGAQRLTNEDAKFVTLRPKKGDGPVRTRKAIVAGKEVIGFQG